MWEVSFGWRIFQKEHAMRDDGPRLGPAIATVEEARIRRRQMPRSVTSNFEDDFADADR